MTELVATRARARRRKLPRPPKLDAWQKLALATWLVIIAVVISSHDLGPSSVALLAAGGARIHSVYMEALRKHREFVQSWCLCLGLIILSVALQIAESR